MGVSQLVMTLFYSAALLILSSFHLIVGVGHIFKVPPYNPATFLVNDKPGTGETPLEKLMEVIVASWYLGSILAVLFAFFTSSSLKVTLVCPLVYHLMLTYYAIFHIEGWAVCNPAWGTHRTVGQVHGVLSCLCVFLFSQSN